MKGEYIRNKIKVSGKKMNQIAADMGITPQALNNILNNEDVKTSSLERIAAVMEVPVTYFYEEGNNYNVTASGNATVVKHGNVNNNEERSVLVLADQLMTKDKQIDRLLTIIEKLSDDEK